MDSTISYTHSASKSESLGIPAFVYATVFASFSIIVGLIWDISWHISIGRDGLLSPPHLAMYVGAMVSGLFSGFQVLKTTIAGKDVEKARSVKFWGIFYGSLGALFCIWGAIAMLTSAPFDDWWHNTYGLDITILSPPHTLLLLGMVGIQFGAMVSVLALQNGTQNHIKSLSGEKILRWIYALETGFFLTMVCTILSEYQGRHDMHRTEFYIVSSLLYPLLLSAFSRSAKTRWGATQAALVYFVFQLLMNWVLPLFPAEPKLGPILNPIDTFQAWEFPLLLFIPAMVIDYINHNKGRNDWLKALMIAPLFMGIHFLIQWYVGEFLMTEYARNWIFGQESWYFGANPDWEFRYAYAPWMEPPFWEMVKGLGLAVVMSILTTRLGLYWGNWMKKVKR